MKTNILRQIFFDENQHWESFKRKHGERIRPVVIKEVERFRDCGNPKNGFKLFVCEGCNDPRKVPYRCKGRFCTTCSLGESEEWSRLLTEDVLQVNHRHGFTKNIAVKASIFHILKAKCFPCHLSKNPFFIVRPQFSSGFMAKTN